ncbi:hypothetical protein GJ496_007056 [Pomphorhynchus laevis]|nr:hypothetical protein GJ496_007056 [Pomphorhynchus laevis]
MSYRDADKFLKPGIEVLIQRSDGRIHPATISEVRYSSRCVCVEWRERNETKGKEILIDVILDLNPPLRLSSFVEKTLISSPAKYADLSSSRNDLARNSIHGQSERVCTTNKITEPEHALNQQDNVSISTVQTSSDFNGDFQHHSPSAESNHLQFRDQANTANVVKAEALKSWRKTVNEALIPKSKLSNEITVQSREVPPTIPSLKTLSQTSNCENRRCVPDFSCGESHTTNTLRPNSMCGITGDRKYNRSADNQQVAGKFVENCDQSKATSKDDLKKTNCLREIQRIAQKRQQRRQQLGQQRYNQNHVGTSRNTNNDNRNDMATNSEGSIVPATIISSLNPNNNQSPKALADFRLMIEQCRNDLQIKAKFHVTSICDSPSSSHLQSITSDKFSGSPITNCTITDKIIVSVRKRPINNREKVRGELDIISIFSQDICIVHSPKEKVDLTKYLDNHKFRFDYAFNENVSTYTIFKYSVKPLIDNVINGHHSMCFAYGQTGSGKTFTMGGNIVDNRVDCSNGIYAYATTDLFQNLDKYHPGKFSLFCSFFEIYCGKVFDLFNRKKRLQVLEDQNGVIQVVNLKQEHVRNVDELMKLIHFGMTMRTSGTTSANENSSRSHAVFRIILKMNQTGADYSRIYLIDLAGSERGRDTSNSDKNTMMEGAEINKSLLALKECIRALTAKADHIPFRGSMLTRVLRDSFIGSSAMISMIAMISPSSTNSEHTLNTLRYADRVKELVTNDDTPDSNNIAKSSSTKFDVAELKNQHIYQPLSSNVNQQQIIKEDNIATSKPPLLDSDAKAMKISSLESRSYNCIHPPERETKQTRHNDDEDINSDHNTTLKADTLVHASTNLLQDNDFAVSSNQFHSIRTRYLQKASILNQEVSVIFSRHPELSISQCASEFERLLTDHITELNHLRLLLSEFQESKDQSGEGHLCGATVIGDEALLLGEFGEVSCELDTYQPLPQQQEDQRTKKPSCNKRKIAKPRVETRKSNASGRATKFKRSITK